MADEKANDMFVIEYVGCDIRCVHLACIILEGVTNKVC